MNDPVEAADRAKFAYLASLLPGEYRRPLVNLALLCRSLTALIVLLAASLAEAGSAADPFEFQTVASPARTAAAELADFDGDGRTDLMSVTYSGMPPNETREVRMHFQNPDGSLPESPSWTGPLPADAAVYDLADLPGSHASELILLTGKGVAVLSFAGRNPTRRDFSIPDFSLIAVARDERSLDRMMLVRSDMGPRPRIVVPGFGECAILETNGELVSRVEVSGRANFYMPPRPGPMISGSELEIHFDFPRLNTGDIDGDGRRDLIVADRHEVRIFLQREDATFPRGADQVLAVERVSEDDHIRSSGNLAIDAADINGDKLADLVISHSGGGLFNPRSQTAIHLNHEGRFDLSDPDQVITARGGIATVQLVDIDRDGTVELIEGRIPMGVLPLVEALITKDIDVEASVYHTSGGELFEAKPWFEVDFEIPFNFDTNRPMGFFPNNDADVNGDGHTDLLISGNGNVIEVYPGGSNHFRKRVARQKADSAGRLRFGDLNGDGLTDLMIYDPLRPDSPIRIGTNQGILPSE
ncbi:MAG: VCBS repeat-containing protein [Myxococcota bacterium]